MLKSELTEENAPPSHGFGDKTTVFLREGLLLCPTPLDECEFKGSQVFCYFKDFGHAVKQHVGFMENKGTFSGKLQILTSSNGHSVKARILATR